ncbi:MAG: mechanosensitive ion channel [Bacteroidia bacterium]|nr:mechanosensitive ion channel [Bacteroidia bacterium]NND11606.1 mechanosensitive ion channel [Flavobacteriaceae bacterium]NNK27720.1 mechanosensitive ion channel [Flavobacteriaceae bacterium]
MDFFTDLFNKLSDGISDFMPTTLGVIILIVLGWIVAKFLKRLITKLIARTGVDEKLKSDKITISSFIGKLIYFLVMIFVFMLALERLGMTSVLQPVKEMLNGFLGYIPNIIGAGLVAYIGYMLATLVSELVGLSGDTIQSFVPKFKLPENLNLVNILKKIVFIFIFIPLLISAFNILKMDAISVPATEMLQNFFDAIPKVLVATIIIIVFVIGGRFITQLLKDLLNSLNLNEFSNKLGLQEMLGKGNIVNIIGNIAYAFIMLFGIVTAVEKLEFNKLTELLNLIITNAGNILFGLVILTIGMWIANIITNNFSKKDGNQFVATIIKVAVMAIFLAIGLRTMGIANEIINLAFGISLGTVAVTIALSFGLGGREAAGEQMRKILDKFNKK